MPPVTHTRLVAPETPGSALAERIAMFAVVTAHPRAASIVEGLVAPSAGAARRLLETFASWPSAKRQARISLEFGQRGDHAERLADIMAEAHADLRAALCAQMNRQQRARYPRLTELGARKIPGRDAFAARLVREASR